MPTVRELYESLANRYPEELRADWDNDGLMVAEDPDREVNRVLCTLDVTDEAIDYAIANHFDVIVSHHPLLFRPLKGLHYQDPTAKKVFRLIANKISVFSFHTRLDAADGGVNDQFARCLGLSNVVPLAWEGEKIGRVGELEFALDCNAFASFVKKTLHADRVLYATAGGLVKKVAICGGDGKDFVKAAKAAGADSYLTGQLSYNIMEESSEIGLNLFEAGHFFTEHFICAYLSLIIMKEFTQVRTAYFDSNRIKSL